MEKLQGDDERLMIDGNKTIVLLYKVYTRRKGCIEKKNDKYFTERKVTVTVRLSNSSIHNVYEVTLIPRITIKD
jgi:hypothetical protein